MPAPRKKPAAKKKPAVKRRATKQAAPQINRTIGPEDPEVTKSMNDISENENMESSPSDSADTETVTSDSPNFSDPYSPKRLELENAGLDQVAAEADRQAELQAERDEHNRRTGDASLR